MLNAIAGDYRIEKNVVSLFRRCLSVFWKIFVPLPFYFPISSPIGQTYTSNPLWHKTKNVVPCNEGNRKNAYFWGDFSFKDWRLKHQVTTLSTWPLTTKNYLVSVQMSVLPFPLSITQECRFLSSNRLRFASLHIDWMT